MILPFTYNWRNLLVRKLSTTLTLVIVAVVVFVLAVLLAFALGIRDSLTASGSSRNLLILKPGATAESTSIILPHEASRVVQAPNIASDSAGNMLVSQEICVQTSILRRGPEGNLANVAVRGVDGEAFLIHDDVKIVEGRRFDSGAMEVIVGKAARQRYQDLEVGGELSLGRLGTRTFKVVGIFEAGGGALESEIWAQRSIIADAYQRQVVSSIVVRLNDEQHAAEAIAYINGPAVNLKATTETEYYEKLAKTTRQIVGLTTVLIGIMAVGAIFAVANTMYSAVDGRRREIAMLRTIGFSRFAIILSFILESLLICLLACALGLAATTLLSGMRQDYMSDRTYTVLAFDLRVTSDIVISALTVAVFVGVVGALAPAIRASRTRIIDALRKA